MLTPYDWQEGIGNRAQYVEGKLAQGSPVLAVSISEGILVFAFRRQARKIYEIYDRLIFAAVGQQSDVEALRSAAVDFAHQEGYSRSEQDVTIQRVVTALSTPLKKAFGDFTSAPIVARSLFAEAGEEQDQDALYVLDYDGDYTLHRSFAVVAGSDEQLERLRPAVEVVDRSLAAKDLVDPLREAWMAGLAEGETAEDMKPEAVLLERSATRENRFTVLVREE